MYKMEELYNALRKADAAGDVESAKRLTQYISSLSSQPQQAQQEVQQGPETAGMKEAFMGGAKRMLGSSQTALEGIFNPEEAAKAGQARQEAITERPGASLEKVKQVYHDKGAMAAAREALSEVPAAISEQAPNLAATLVNARLGAMAGSVFGPAGTVIGGLGGAFIPSYLQQSGSNLERQAQEGKPISAAGAYGAAVPQAALDVFTDRLMFSKLMGIPVKQLGRKEAEEVVAKSLKRTIAEGTAKGALAEIPTEVTQQMLERYQAGLSLTDADARKEYADTAYQVALLGPLGAIGNVQERGEAKQVIAKDEAAKAAAAAQAQRQATGVMDQQALFTPQEAPIPEPTLTPPGAAEPISTIQPEPTQPAAEQPVPEGQGELFTKKGAPTKEALAGVEVARLQGLPAQVQDLMQTPEGRALLAGDMKTYFPHMTVKERNQARVQIQQGTFGVEPVEVPEGTLTRDYLKEMGFRPGSKTFNAVVDKHISDPMTYKYLSALAETGTDQGVKANRILEQFPHFNPNQPTPDLFAGVPNEQPQSSAPQATEPLQGDFFGVPENGVPNTVEQQGTEPGMGQPVQQQAAATEEAPESVGRGVDGNQPVPAGNIAESGASDTAQPSALAPVPKKVARDAAAALKKEPVEDAWGYMSDTPFSDLSKTSQDRVRDAHRQGYLNQDLADDVERIEATNARNAAAAAATQPEAPLEDTPEGYAGEMAAMPEIKDHPTVTDEMAHIEKSLEGKTLYQAAQWMAENAPSKTHRLIAGILAKRFKDFTANGVQFKFAITTENGRGLRARFPFGTGGSCKTSFSKFAGKQQITVRIQGSFAGEKYSGLQYSTILHEMVHAGVDAAIHSARLSTHSKAGKAPYVEFYERLQDVKDVLRKELQARIDNGTATQDEKEYFKYANTFDNEFELVAWGLTEPKAQAIMDSIQLPTKKSLWAEFVTAIRNVLGIPASANTALSEILDVGHSLLNVGYEDIRSTFDNLSFQKDITSYQIDPQAQAQAQQALQGMSGMYAQSHPNPTQTATQSAANVGQMIMNNPGGAIGMLERKINAWRNAVVWRGATLADDIQRANDNAFRDAYNQIRPDLIMSQAEAGRNLTESVFVFGGIEITPDGSFHAVEKDHSIDGVFRSAKTLADRIGADTARELITKTFYAWRAQALLQLPQNEWPENWKTNPTLIPTQAQINAAMAAFNQFPELAAMRREFIGAKNEAVKFLHQADFLTDEKARAFLADDSYAPWFRLKEYQDNLPGLGNMGRMVDLQQMQALKGGSEEVNDMLENMAQVVSWMVRSGVGNHTANRALRTMEDMGTATKSRSRPNGDPHNIVMTYVDGKRMFWTVSDPLQLQAFQSVKAMNSPVISTINKYMATLRAGIVLFPAFPIRQVVMDSYRAYAQSGVDHPTKMVGKVLKSFLSGEAYRGMHADIIEMKKYGVVGSADYNMNDATRGRAENFGLEAGKKGITAAWTRSPVYKALHKFEYSADLAVRLGVYRQTMEETGDKELAIARAREIINFQKSGNSELMLTLKQMIPFMGAYLQGSDVNYRSMIGRGNTMKSRKAAAAAFWGNMATLAALSVAYTMCMSGDDDYEDQKGYVTDRNFIIPGIGLLPVPTDVGFLAKVIPERLTDYILQQGTDNPESLDRLVDGIRSAASAAYLPPAAVYGVTPAIEVALNKSFFTDIPIVGQHMQSLAPFEQYTSNTSELAKTAGGIANISPMKIDYILKAIGGTSAGALLQLADVMMSDQNRIATEKNPIIGSFQEKKVGGRYAEEYYETRSLVDEAYQTANAMYEAGEADKLKEYMAKPEIQNRLAARTGIEQLNTFMQDVRKTRSMIEADPTLSPDEKRTRVNDLLAMTEKALKESGIRKLRNMME